MPRVSAGLLLYRRRQRLLEVFLVHPGGPFWANKDAGAWMIPKGEFIPGEEDPLAAALREFQEETGFSPPPPPYHPLAPIKQAGGKVVHAWAVEGDCVAEAIKSNTMAVEWPPRSGRYQQVPEVDRAQWFDLPVAREKILKSQAPLLEALERDLPLW